MCMQCVEVRQLREISEYIGLVLSLRDIYNGWVIDYNVLFLRGDEKGLYNIGARVIYVERKNYKRLYRLLKRTRGHLDKNGILVLVIVSAHKNALISIYTSRQVIDDGDLLDILYMDAVAFRA